jgi:hypothetical protein
MVVYIAAAHPFHMQACYVLSAVLLLACPLFPQAMYGVFFVCADIVPCYSSLHLKSIKNRYLGGL